MDSKKKWIAISDLIDYLPQVAKFEEKRREEERTKSISKERRKPKINIKSMCYSGKNSKLYKFKVVYEDGTIAELSNKELKREFPEELITFYEKNIILRP